MAEKSPLPDSAYSPTWADDPRTLPSWTGEERELLVGYLDYYRATIEMKCAGVPKERLNERTMPPSTLTLHGLIRHLAGAEAWWFKHQFAREDLEHMYDFVDEPDEFEDLSGDFDEALALWRANCQRSREIVARHSLDDTGVRERTGEPFSLRNLMFRMIIEYARHSGHADLLREGIDGATGM